MASFVCRKIMFIDIPPRIAVFDFVGRINAQDPTGAS